MKRTFVLIVCILFPLFFNATELGRDKEACQYRYYVTSGVVSVRSEPNTTASAAGKISSGDIIYVDSEEKISSAGMIWVKVSGEEMYIPALRLSKEKNPNYVVPKGFKTEEERLKHSVIFGTFDLPIWLLISLMIIFGLITMWLFITFSDDDPYNGSFPRFAGEYKFPNLKKMLEVYGSENQKKQAPQRNNMIFRLWSLFWAGIETEREDYDVSRFKKKYYGYGMRKILFFSPSPYVFVIQVAILILLAFCITIIISFLLGGVLWLGCSALGIFSSSIQEWGNSIFDTFNVFGLSMYLAKSYWKAALVIALFPLALFLALAIVFYVFAISLILFEKGQLKKYNANEKNACPTCAFPSEPATYLSHGMPLPVNLEPGPWGLFHITHPVTGEKMPTLFINGKDKYERKCARCGNLISAEIGVEKHIGVVGTAQAGKTALLYRMISELLSKKVGSQTVANIIDDMGVNDKAIRDYLDNAIKDGGQMEYFPEKTGTDRQKSIQFHVYNSKSRFPYRLYLNDVAGEVLTADNTGTDAAFLQNTDILIFVIDPYTMDVSHRDLSNRMRTWYEVNVGSVSDSRGKVDMDEAINALWNLASHYGRGDKDKMSVMMTFVKTDTGYLSGINTADQNALRQFMIDDLGLENALFNFENSGLFDSVSFHAVSAKDEAEHSGIRPFMSNLFDTLGMSFTGVSADDVHRDHLVAEQVQKFKEKENRRYENYKRRSPRSGRPTKLGIILFFLVLGAVISFIGVRTMSIHKENYNKIMSQVNVIMSQTPAEEIDYERALSLIDESIKHEKLGEKFANLLRGEANSIQKNRNDLVESYMGLLRNNFMIEDGKSCSNIELCAKYGLKDSLAQVKQLLDKMALLSPDNEEYIQYKNEFESIIKKYKIKY